MLICIIGVVALIVKLDIIEIDKMSDLLVDVDICSIFVPFCAKIRSLRSMSDYMIGNNLSEFLCERYQPLLACSVLHGVIIFPVNIDSI